MSIQNQLFDAVYYGTDLEFQYNGNYYFINSGKMVQGTTGVHSITVFRSKKSFYERNNNPQCEKIYSACQKDADENARSLFEEKIFDGKSLFEIINDISDISY